MPDESAGFVAALRAAFEGLLAPAEPGAYGPDTTNRMLFVVPTMIEALVHGIPGRPSFLSPDGAREETVRTVLVYLSSCGRARG